MQHGPERNPPALYFHRERRSSLTSTGETRDFVKETGDFVEETGDFAEETRDFAETLPREMSLKILGELDTESLCSASLTCRLWHHLIQDSDQLWRNHCLTVRAVCQREVDRDRHDGMSWKVTLVRNYQRSFLKRDWLRGRYSNVRSVEELRDVCMCPLDLETWGEILEAELER